MLASQNRRAFTLIELLVVLAIIAVLIALLIPAVQKVRSAAQRTESINNLCQLIMAAHSFHDSNGFLPFNGTVDATNGDNNSGSWAYQLLPYLEQRALYDTQPNSSLVLTTPVDPFLCAMAARPGYYTGAPGVTGTILTQLPPATEWTTAATFTVNPGSSYTYSLTPGITDYNTHIINGTATIAYWHTGQTSPSKTFTMGAGLYDDMESTEPGYIVITAISGNTGPDNGPTGPATDFGINPYINSATGALNAPNSYQTLTSIPDGTSNTIFLGHMYAPVAEYPLTTASSPNARLSIFCGGTDGTSRNGLGDTATTWLQDGTTIAQNQWGSPMREGGLMATADGSVHLIPYSMPLKQLLIPNDGAVVDLP